MATTIHGGDIPEVQADPTAAGAAQAPLNSRIRFGADVYQKVGDASDEWFKHALSEVGVCSVKIASGTLNVPAGSDAVTGPVTVPAAFLPSYTLGVKASVPGTTDVLTFRGSADGGDIDVFYETTGVADQYQVHIFNNTGTAYDVAWSINAEQA
jgi:hypothetical protein